MKAAPGSAPLLETLPQVSLESRAQAELPDQARARTVERMGRVDFEDGKTKQVQPKRHTCAVDRLPLAATEERIVRVVDITPGNSAVAEERHFNREAAVVPAAHVQDAEQGEAELDVSKQHFAAQQTIERRAVEAARTDQSHIYPAFARDVKRVLIVS